MAGTGSLSTPPPVYRHLLSGAPDIFRLPARSAVLLAGFGMMLLAVALFGRSDWIARLPSAVATLLTALLLAVLAARWFGSRTGLLAGLVYLSMAGVLVCWPGTCGTDSALAFCVAAALGAFGLGNAAGRRPLQNEPWVARLFYAAAGTSFLLVGPTGPLMILAGCLLFLFLGEDPRGLRFFASPTGLLIFALLAAAWPLAGWDGRWGLLDGWLAAAPGQRASTPHLLAELALACLPWTPFVLLALVVGFWRGYAFTPGWRLFGAWAFGSLAVMAVAPSGRQPDPGAILAPLAAMAAAAVSESLQWTCRGTARRCAWIVAAWVTACAAALAAMRWWGLQGAHDAALAVHFAAAGLLLVIFFQSRRHATGPAARSGDPRQQVRVQSVECKV